MRYDQNLPIKDPEHFIKLFHSLALNVALSQVFVEIDLPPEQLALHFSHMLLTYFDLPLVVERGMGENSSDQLIGGSEQGRYEQEEVEKERKS